MKKTVLYGAILGCICLLGSCGSSKKIEKSPVDTYVMPCSELKSGDGVIRAWASGNSDNEMTARKKAQAAASAELAAMLEKTVKTTTEDYISTLSEGQASESKSFFNEKTRITVEKTLKGATIVCDRWVKDEKTGQHTNYIVMELRGEEYLKSLYEEMSKVSSIDKALLEKLFIENIDSIEQE